jgi:hypothetical protein
MDARLDFGKHRGKLVSDVPTSYLSWLIRERHSIDPWLLRAVREEVAGRERERNQERRRARQSAEAERDGESSYAPVSTQWSAVIRERFRGLAKVYHPDRGGSVEVMSALNEARSRLEKLVGV